MSLIYDGCMEAAVRAPAMFISLFSPTKSFNSLPSLSFLPQLSSRSIISSSKVLSHRSISLQSHSRAMAVGSQTNMIVDTSAKGAESLFRLAVRSMEKVYLDRNPTAKAVLDLVLSVDGNQICYDHFAFRTFGVDGYGIDSVAKFFLDFGYTMMEELRFPAKKLKALWFAPPNYDNGSYFGGPLPRIFVSELLVDEMSPQSQAVIKKYVKNFRNANRYAALASTLGCLTWEIPSYSDYQQLARESEYAAWTLVNGFTVNHVTISVHRLKSQIGNIKSLNQFIDDQGFKLNSEGGILKVSPDGLLLQSSTVADSTIFNFSDGVSESVPCSYIEFAERLVLPQYTKLTNEEIKEFHRRDGFEVGNADKIFESTSMDQITRKVA
ncbi:hypothetical protein IEQ34_020196 [Dendrobium chrysotoxum]|uniref:2-oxoadipate dioxygenase/decarboxylase n=1 Tax=Dendrobium chrysotoxum TaxID=161865 RepID=A0AAV7FKH4_DENCH|nr:hypothetical protein IEQ34_020196 [Dendrobium chrysotoxum]